jgi:L-malate glycosyltransferase
MIVERKKKILIICPHQYGVVQGQRLRYEQFVPFFEENNYKVTVAPFNSKRLQKILYLKGRLFEKALWFIWGYLKRFATIPLLPFYDCIYVFLWVVPDGSTLFERIYLKLARKTVYDIDDLVFKSNDSNINGIIKYIRSENNYLYLIKKADKIVLNNPYLRKLVCDYTIPEKICYIPISINTNNYVPVTNKNNLLIIGWTGSFSTLPYFILLEGVLQRISKKYSVKVLVMCDLPEIKMEGVDIEFVEFKKSHEIEQIQRMDIGLYPLPDNEWVLAKGGGKALQYMALAIPTIATNLGINSEIIEDNVSGLLVPVGDEDRWVEKLSLLIEDAELRKFIGQNGRTKIESTFSFDKNKHLYVDLLNSLTQ